MRVRLIQVDGKLPNLALMRLSKFHRSRGDEVVYTRRPDRELFDGKFDRVYASTIFKWSKPVVDRIRREWPGVVVGGTGTDDLGFTVEKHLGLTEPLNELDYSIYPKFENSIGFSMNGCRLRCGFCVVPEKEGRPRVNQSIHDIWRGEPYPRHIHLLDNDFFGQPRDIWKARIQEMIDGNFKVSFNQGLNVRLINEEACEWLAKVKYYDDSFTKRRVYTAWDNLKDEGIFKRGIDYMTGAGINPKHIMVYMLVGYDPKETMERIFYRFNEMLSLGVLPYPMVYDRSNKELCYFQRWVLRGYYRFVKWEDFDKPALRNK